MKTIESRDALAAALNNIAELATENGLKAETRCFIADHDLIELSEDELSAAALIAGEITVSADGTDEKMLLECALSVTDGEVSDDEIISEVGTLRANMKEICSKVSELGNAKDAFEALSPEEPEAKEEPKYDNKRFYIIASIVAVAVIVLMVLLK